MGKTSVQDHLPKKISQIDFGVFSAQDMKALSILELYDRNLYNISLPNRPPSEFGVLDRRLVCLLMLITGNCH
jgi:hypothetical protein